MPPTLTAWWALSDNRERCGRPPQPIDPSRPEKQLAKGSWAAQTLPPLSMKNKLKVGLIVDEERLCKHDRELVGWANSGDTILISHLIVQHRSAPARKRPLLARLALHSLGSLMAIALWRIKERKEVRQVAAIEAYRDSERSFEVGESVPGRIYVKPLQSGSEGRVHRFSEEDLAAIRREQFDLLIRCGSGILRGGILRSARLGVLSFHHGDNRVNRGGPPGFWEVYHRWSRTGFVVQILTEELDGGHVLLRGFVPTEPTHLLNRALLYHKSYFHLRALLERIASSGELPAAEPQLPYSGRLFVAPRAREIAAYLLKRAGRTLIGHMRDLRQQRERWGVCYLKSDWPSAAFWRGTRIETPAGRFLADPFVATREGRTCVFVEDYPYATEKGHISAFEIGDCGARELGIALEEKFHLSFPFLFEHRGALFMCPESIGAEQIRIYRCSRFPLEWKLEHVAMQGVWAADSMLFPHEDQWWLFTNLSRAQPIEFNSELHIFSAPDPLSNSWTPHPKNPVLIDPSCARNAGLLRSGGIGIGIVRVCQQHSFGTYGASARLMRITRLDGDGYAEEPIGRLTPDFVARAHGTHHFHSNGLYSVWDYKRWERIRTRPPQTQSAPRPS